MSADSSSFILAVVGLQREAKIVLRDGVRVAVGGADSSALERKIEAVLSESGASLRGIISTGIAGALDPSLQIGDCVVADGVAASGGAVMTDARWLTTLRASLPSARQGAIAGVDVLSADAEAKRELRASSNAVAVDMESHIAARCAAGHDIPFAVLRVISDRADQSLPDAARVAMKPDGGINLGAITGSVMRNPRQIPQLVRLGRDSNAAFGELLRCLDALGLGLACPYLG